MPARFRSWIIRFESVNYNATVWLNGRQIGTHAGAYLPFEFDLKGVRTGVNRLIVRVDDRRTPGDLPPGPSGGWWNFGGIQREVYLRPVQRADMSQVVVRPTLPCPTCAATVHEQVSVRNTTTSPQTVVLQGSYGGLALNFGGHTIAPGRTWVAQAHVVIAVPHLWAPDDPYLYQATLALSDQHGRRLQGYFTDSGIRSITVTPTGQLELNGRPLDLRGVSIHEQNITDGAALDPGQLAALVGWAHELGSTIIRAHYPLNPQITQLADQDGILLWSEIPVYQVASPFLRQGAWLRRAHAMLRENIAENQNHPSVLLWSIANELATPPNDAEASYIAGAAAIAHQMDPTRPVGMAIEDWPGIVAGDYSSTRSTGAAGLDLGEETTTVIARARFSSTACRWPDGADRGADSGSTATAARAEVAAWARRQPGGVVWRRPGGRADDEARRSLDGGDPLGSPHRKEPDQPSSNQRAHLIARLLKPSPWPP